ncbi:hypothetical protein GQR58_006088 [Nymphon striatum]|nr:hypothetical protein GQR58_006088 [Nymphon striatum]
MGPGGPRGSITVACRPLWTVTAHTRMFIGTRLCYSLGGMWHMVISCDRHVFVNGPALLTRYGRGDHKKICVVLDLRLPLIFKVQNNSFFGVILTPSILIPLRLTLVLVLSMSAILFFQLPSMVEIAVSKPLSRICRRAFHQSHVYKLHPYIASLFITHFDNLGILYIIIWGDGLPCTLPLRFSRQSAPPADLRVRVSFFVFEVLLIKFIVLYIENENDELREFFVAD